MTGTDSSVAKKARAVALKHGYDGAEHIGSVDEWEVYMPTVDGLGGSARVGDPGVIVASARAAVLVVPPESYKILAQLPDDE